MLAGTATGAAAARMISNERLVVPAHFDVEVYGAFRRLFRAGRVGRTQLNAIVSRIVSLAAERVGLSSLLPEAHVLADRVSATDAFYVALARARGVEILTADVRLAQGAAGLAQIRLITPG